MAAVLLIEPDRVLVRTYAQALRHAGHTAIPVHSAQDAINAADDRKPDIVIIELQMAAHDGIEFLHEFRSYPEWREIPVIVNTALLPSALAPVSQALANDLGVVACLYKPHTSLQQLISAVNLQLVDAA